MQNYAHKDLYNKAINITEHNTNSRSSKDIYLSPSSRTPVGIPHHQKMIGSEDKAGLLQIDWLCWNDLAHIACCTLKKITKLVTNTVYKHIIGEHNYNIWFITLTLPGEAIDEFVQTRK